MPQLGRFLSLDPVAGGSANAYDYANQAPINTFDLSGERVGCGASLKVSSHRHRIYTRSRYRCPNSDWPFGHAFLRLQIRFERHTKGLKDEVLYGKFERKGAWEWKPKNPYDGQWRNFGADESFYCGDIGREYQMVYIAVVRLESPVNGVIKTINKTFEVKDQTVCRR